MDIDHIQFDDPMCFCGDYFDKSMLKYHRRGPGKTSWENIDTSSIRYFPRQTGALIGPHKNICVLIGWLSRVVYSTAAEQSSVSAVQPSKGGASSRVLLSPVSDKL